MKVNKIAFSESRLLIRFYQLLIGAGTSGKKNLNETEGILFVHNPKVAGNSLHRFIWGDNERRYTSHRTPTFLVTKQMWETNVSIVAVRHPFDRLISSYSYHTKPEYQGYFSKKLPKLKEMTLEEYFDFFKNVPYVIMPQYYYTRHFLSKKEVDYILRFEDLENDIKEVSQKLRLNYHEIPHLNASKRSKANLIISDSLKQKIINYYRKDFDLLGYTTDFQKYQ